MEETPPRQFEFYTPVGNRNSSLHIDILYTHGIYCIMFFYFIITFSIVFKHLYYLRYDKFAQSEQEWCIHAHYTHYTILLVLLNKRKQKKKKRVIINLEPRGRFDICEGIIIKKFAYYYKEIFDSKTRMYLNNCRF